MSAAANPYIPLPVTIEKITLENEARDLKTFRLVFCNAGDAVNFKHACGQFAMLSVQGTGEIPIGIASSPLDKGYIEFTVKRYPTGLVTTALHDMAEGDTLGVRGPLGNSFPLKDLLGKSLVIISGGFAFTTLRATIRYLLDPAIRGNYKDITVLYGARSPGELLYKSELLEWQKRSDMKTYITVDNGDSGWNGRTGLVPNILKEIAPTSSNAACLVCGPPIMLKFTIPPLLALGFAPETIFTSLERKMSCGIGKCGRCNVGKYYVCKDGPVFAYSQIMNIPENGF
ncbi:MAG: FAD/NAD(P)-binding protein [Chitinivibrionales bacterium]|nr:FAD/NAD(P)-binding protein [Chitinivibrionales bacterium]